MAGKEKVENFVYRHSKLSIILIYNGVILAMAIIFYQMLPIIMGYPPNGFNVTKNLGMSYMFQYGIIIVAAIIAGTVALLAAFKGIGKWKELLDCPEGHEEELREIRKKCINFPYIIYISQICFTSAPLLLLMVTVSGMTKIPISTELKIFTLAFSFFSLAAVVSHTFSKRIFTQILLRTYRGEGLQGIRISLRKKIFLQMLPISIVAILFTGMLGYSRLMEEKGDLVYRICKSHLAQSLEDMGGIQNIERVLSSFQSLDIDGAKISYFILTEKGDFISSDKYKPTAFFSYYVKNPLNGDRVYGDTNETQAVVAKIQGKVGSFTVGIKYELASNKTVLFFLAAFMSLLLLNIFVLYYFAKSLADEISMVAESLNDIAEGDMADLDGKLAVISNDELADLVIAFNKIQEREKEHIREIEEKHAIMIAQERLVTLGHLIGGIAHNLRTPIMSISGAIEGIRDLAEEYDQSIDDANVTKEDHHEIAKEIHAMVEKMRPYCSYMSDIITAVKGQATQSSSQPAGGFTLDELNKRIAILFEYELRKQHCKLNTVYNVDMNTKINGDISDLIQILNNLILNAADSYEGKGGNIELTVNGSKKVIEFIIKDYGSGIPEDVQGRLFKEMITTKGSKGTGLGLYMSYSNVKARFGGKIRFDSKKGQGTTFYLYIPL